MARTKDDVIKEPKAEAKAKPVKRIKLTAPHAYFTDNGQFCAWQAGQILEGDEAEHLIDRKAHHEELQ